jgi:hypothetical protein
MGKKRAGRPQLSKDRVPKRGEDKDRDWSPEEVRVIVADYFEMLELEMSNRKYNKSEHRRTLMPLLDRRSKSAVEYKHQNISAALLEMGYAYIDGYKPLQGYQRSELPPAIEQFLAEHPDFSERLIASPRLAPDARPQIARLDGIVESPPEEILKPQISGKPWLSKKGQRVDFAHRDATNRETAKLGEEFALEFERKRLQNAGRDDLARRVDWVSQTIGDGLGFDILSFDDGDSSHRYVEVKTTRCGKYFPFYVSANEVRCSEDVRQQYRLYRLFDFSRSPRLYILTGSLSAACKLDPVQFVATI